MTRCYLFDIDGTLSDLTHRLHHIQKEPKDWNAFFDGCGDDAPIKHIVNLAISLDDAEGPDVVFWSEADDSWVIEVDSTLNSKTGAVKMKTDRREYLTHWMPLPEPPILHRSDCATNAAPAYEPGSCDCGASK